MPGAAAPAPGLYEHWKGGVYRLLFLAEDEATKEPLAVYVCVSDRAGRLWARPAASWSEEVDAPGGRRPRFLRAGP